MTYSYSISDSFSGGVNSDALVTEIKAALPIPALVSLTTGDDICRIDFGSALSVSEKTTLDAVVAAHLGATTKSTVYGASYPIVPAAVSITATAAWQIIGGVVMDVTSRIAFLIQGMCKVTLGTADMRMVQSIAGVDTQIAITTDVATADWSIFQLKTDPSVPPALGLCEFRLESRTAIGGVVDVRSVVAQQLDVV